MRFEALLLKPVHRMLLTAACAKRKSMSEVVEDIIREWQIKYARDLREWKGRTEEIGPQFHKLDLPYDDWYADDPKTKVLFMLEVDLVKDLYPGMVMHKLKKSWLMTGLIWLWFMEHRKEMTGYLSMKEEDLRKRIPRLNLGRPRKPRAPKEEDHDENLPLHLRPPLNR
jgi:hypothetical protein